MVGCSIRLVPAPSSRKVVVSCSASTGRPAAARAVRAKALAIISLTRTRSLRKKRLRRISPARQPPRRRTRTPLVPTATSRSSKKSPLIWADTSVKCWSQVLP
jgi:hypothetical protein